MYYIYMYYISTNKRVKMCLLTRTGFRNLARVQYLPLSSSRAALTARLSVSSKLRRFSWTTAAEDSRSLLISAPFAQEELCNWLGIWPCKSTWPFRAFFFCSRKVSVECFFNSLRAFLYSIYNKQTNTKGWIAFLSLEITLEALFVCQIKCNSNNAPFSRILLRLYYYYYFF